MTGQPLKVGFLASGNGSSARAIVAAAQAGRLAIEPRVLVSNRRESPALDFARGAGLTAVCIPTLPDADDADRRLVELMQAENVELIVLSGYMRLLGPRTLKAYANRVLNIHPGPLPDFGGHGMYGRRVHEAVIAAGAAQSGITIHLVDGEYDRGPIVAARSVPVQPGDTAETLEKRVTSLEPAFFVETLQGIVSGAISLPA